MDTHPILSVIVLAWNQLELTRRCVDSIRSNTDVSYELILVDNGSATDSVEFARGNADRFILNSENRGFAAGMNQGLVAAAGDYVAFVNNDTIFPPHWASRLIEALEEVPKAGIVLPAVSAAGNPFSVRSIAGTERIVVPPFRHLPSGVVYVMDRGMMTELGGWDERYGLASREDLDLLFTVWVNGLDVILDEAVFVTHESNVTAREQLDDRAGLWRRNGAIFVDRWTQVTPDTVATLTGVNELEVEARCDQARTAAEWLGRVLAEQDQIESWKAVVRDLKAQNRKLSYDLAVASRPRPGIVHRIGRRLLKIVRSGDD